MGYLQTRYSNHYMRSGLIDLEYWRDHCKSIFGEAFTPNVTHTNIDLGSLSLRGSKILFTNGSEDIWKGCSILDLPEEDEMSAIEIECDDCAHCVELYDEKEEDPENLKLAREKIREFINEILA
jgi:hypothetical protein